MQTQYIFVDYESVQPSAMAALDQTHVKVIVFVGASQAKVSFEIAAALQGMGARARYVKISGNGPNALDFHIAYYLGQLALAEPDAVFHVISKDTGFDPLLAHLNAEKVSARRLSELSVPETVKVPMSQALAEKQATVVSNLRRYGAAKPRTLTKLSNVIQSLFQKTLKGEELASLLQSLKAHGIISVNDTKVSYSLTG